MPDICILKGGSKKIPDEHKKIFPRHTFFPPV
jgi:hypothetical protein